jgi:hypothetical protein
LAFPDGGDAASPFDPIPQRIRRFVEAHLESVAELEGLLLVRSAPERSWTARALADRLYIGEPHARVVLEALHRRDLMARQGDAYVYRPAPALHAEVEALAAAYPGLLIAITELIHAGGRSRRRQT